MSEASVRWLTGRQQKAWRAFLEASQLLFDELDRDLQEKASLSHADYEILARLSEADDKRMRMSELAAQTLFSRSRISHAVARLEQAGWIRRESCPSDKRGMLAVLTDAGQAVLEAAAPDHVAAVRRYVFDHLSPAQVVVLERVSASIREHLPATRCDDTTSASCTDA